MRGKDKRVTFVDSICYPKSLFQTECIWNTSRLTLSFFRCTRSSQFTASTPSRSTFLGATFCTTPRYFL